MKRFKVEDKRLLEPKPTMYITLSKGPYTKKRILNKTGWLTKNAKVTECVQYNNLMKDGILALNLPAYTCKRWIANTGHYMGGTPHVHTFKLKKTKII